MTVKVVDEGQVIGLSGSTGGHTTGQHIHLEMRECDVEIGSRAARDPMTALLPGQGGFCNWESLGTGVTCSEYRADPDNTCPGLP